MLVAPSARDLPLRLLALGISASTMKRLLAFAPAWAYAAVRWLMTAQCLIFANAYAPRRPVALVMPLVMNGDGVVAIRVMILKLDEDDDGGG